MKASIKVVIHCSNKDCDRTLDGTIPLGFERKITDKKIFEIVMSQQIPPDYPVIHHNTFIPDWQMVDSCCCEVYCCNECRENDAN